PPIPLQGMRSVEVHDGGLLGFVQPVVTRHPGVVLVGLAVAVFPIVPLAPRQADPHQEGEDSDASRAGPTIHKVHDLVARIVAHPHALQGSPSSFFSWTYSCI